MVENKIVFGADGLKIYGPKEDGSYSITFTTGEYERGKIASLFLFGGKNLKVTVEEFKEKGGVEIPPVSIPT